MSHKHLLRLSLLALICLAYRAEAKAKPTLDSLTQADTPINRQADGKTLLNHSLEVSLPMLALSLPYTIANNEVRAIRYSYLPNFKNRYDDYLQFAPFATQWGLRALGVKGYSQSWSELLTADALGLSIMFASVTLGKQLSGIERPDGSAHNSFPSGHTAMAFASATLLHLEYGERYPLISSLGYLTAGSVGVGRILNNRHWLGDVAMGMNVGILSAELGYWLSGVIHRHKQRGRISEPMIKNLDLRISLPWFTSLGVNPRGRGTGIGLRLLLPKNRYFVEASFAYEAYRHLPSATMDTNYIRSERVRLGIGKQWQGIYHPQLSLDANTSISLEQGNFFPSIGVSPRWQFSPRLSYVLGLGYDYRPINSYPISIRPSASNHRLYLRSAFEVRL